MQVTTIGTTNRTEAARLFRCYADAHRIRPNDNDLALMRVYRAMSKGLPVFDAVQAFRETGLDEKGRPRLALVRADARAVFYRHVGRGGGLFAPFDLWGKGRRRTLLAGKLISVPDGTFDAAQIPQFSGNQIRAVVPTIPPQHRPARGLQRYHILFEADWTEVPYDPFLVKHLYGSLFAVIRQWDLSEVERMVLAMIERQGGTR